MGNKIEILIDSFATNATSRLMTLSGAVKAGQADEIRIECTAIRGICGNFGAICMSKLACELSAKVKSNKMTAFDIRSECFGALVVFKQTTQAHLILSY